MSTPAKFVPTWIRIIVGLLAVFNLLFGIMGYANPSAVLPAAASTADPAALTAVGQVFSARNTAIAIALLIVSIVGVPESIAIVTIIRFLVEAQDLVLTLIRGDGGSGLILNIVFLVVEAVIIVTAFRIVGEQHKASRH